MGIEQAKRNPAVAVTFHLEDGTTIRWVLEKPWGQIDMFSEIGRLGARYDLGINFDLPEQTRSLEDLQRAHDCLWSFVMGEHPLTGHIPEEVRLEMEQVKAAQAALEATCWFLRRDHIVTFEENLEKLGWRDMDEVTEEDPIE